MALPTERIRELWENYNPMKGIESFARSVEAEVRRDALEEAAKACEAMHEEDRPGDYAYSIRKLKEDVQ